MATPARCASVPLNLRPSVFICGFVLFASSVFVGCVSIPYYTTLRGPIQAIRVVDAETGGDIPDAQVSLLSQKSERFLGPPPSTLTCPSLFETQAARRGRLLRNDDGSFHASWGFAEGSRGICITQPGDANEYPRGIVTVEAPGYRPAKLRYTAGQIKSDWACVEAAEEGEAETLTQANGRANAQGLNRCDFRDGVLRFYLRRNVESKPATQPNEANVPGL